MRIKVAVFSALLPLTATAQEPMSVIEWLRQNPPTAVPGFRLLEPPVTTTALRPDIEVSPLDEIEAPLGLVPSDVTGLPADIWRRSDPDVLSELIAEVPVSDHPAMQTLLYSLLLSETAAPDDSESGERFLLARIDRLMDLGAVDPAQALLELAGPTQTRERFDRWFDATLLTGDEERSCAALNAAPYLAPGYAAQIFCTARQGDWAAAAVMLDGALALGLIPEDKVRLLDRFLHAEDTDGAPPLPIPDAPCPLAFRLFEAIGESLPTAALPRAFATADLRDLAGWKAQLEAAERLARTGALPPNQLLGLYTARLPAASGGIWDRVAALQRFETALATSSTDAISKTLPAVWDAMKSARLEVPFATLFADKLSDQPALDTIGTSLLLTIRLLSPTFEATKADPATQDSRFLLALAHGATDLPTASHPKSQAIAEAFAGFPHLPETIASMVNDGRLGEAILTAMALFDSGARGNLDDLTDALATFRTLGFETIARRSALQLILLERT